MISNQSRITNHQSPSFLTGIVGYPLEHTLSPQMHNAAFKALGMQGEYRRLPVTREKLPELLQQLAGEGYKGVNVTIPHKEEALILADWLSEEARSAGAVNTLVFEKSGDIKGYNTDIHGFSRSLQLLDITVTGKSVLILGAGGAARACGYALHALKPGKMFVANRTEQRALMAASAIDAEPMALTKISAVLRSIDFVVNTLPLDVTEKVMSAMRPDSVYYDLNYRFTKKPDTGRVRFVNGLLMLVLQGAEAFRIWTGVKPPETEMLKAVGYE
ncbi:MAG: shikimate dehydrogenase [Candidatus Wallbacteria bacterium]|nr:shikimate dehydrogenase [Candidatus Wallbacteria bacterium]